MKGIIPTNQRKNVNSHAIAAAKELSAIVQNPNAPASEQLAAKLSLHQVFNYGLVPATGETPANASTTPKPIVPKPKFTQKDLDEAVNELRETIDAIPPSR